MREDRQTLMLAHLSQLLDLVTGFGGFIWLARLTDLQMADCICTMFLYALICVPLILLIGLGFLGLIAIGIICLVFPVINAIKVNNGEEPHYPFSIRFIN